MTWEGLYLDQSCNSQRFDSSSSLLCSCSFFGNHWQQDVERRGKGDFKWLHLGCHCQRPSWKKPPLSPSTAGQLAGKVAPISLAITPHRKSWIPSSGVKPWKGGNSSAWIASEKLLLDLPKAFGWGKMYPAIYMNSMIYMLKKGWQNNVTKIPLGENEGRKWQEEE